MIKTKLFELHLSKKVLFCQQKLHIEGYDFSKYLNGRFAANLKKIRVMTSSEFRSQEFMDSWETLRNRWD